MNVPAGGAPPPFDLRLGAPPIDPHVHTIPTWSEIVFDPALGPYHLALMFIFGALFGSFFNVCIYRIPMGVSIVKPDSHCFRCGTPVRWHDNIPLVSYWLLRGRCRDCGQQFSMRYFFIELVAACLFLLCGWLFGYSLALIPALVFVSLLLIASFTDIDHWIIPHRISVGGIGAGILLAALWPLGGAPGNPLAEGLFSQLPAQVAPLARSAVGAAVGFAALWGVGKLGSLIFRKEAMGFGDVILFGMFGAFLGPFPLVYVLLIACIVGTAFGVAGIVAGRLAAGAPIDRAIAPLEPSADVAMGLVADKEMSVEERLVVLRALVQPGTVGAVRHHLPFGPSLAVGALTMYLFGEPIMAWLQRLMVFPIY